MAFFDHVRTLLCTFSIFDHLPTPKCKLNLWKLPYDLQFCFPWPSSFWGVRHWRASKLCNQVRSLDHFVVQNSGDFLCWKYKERTWLHSFDFHLENILSLTLNIKVKVPIKCVLKWKVCCNKCVFWFVRFFHFCPLSQPNSLKRSPTVGYFYEKYLRFWLVLGTEKKIGGRLWATFESGFFFIFSGAKKSLIFFENIVASALNSCIKWR